MRCGLESSDWNLAMRVLLLLLLLPLLWYRAGSASASDARGDGDGGSSIGADALEILEAAAKNGSGVEGFGGAANGTGGNATFSVRWDVKSNDTRNKEVNDKASQIVKNVEKLFDSLEDDSQKEAGKFNDTIENQGGVLETVARVGKHSMDEEEPGSNGKESEQQSGKDDKPDEEKAIGPEGVVVVPQQQQTNATAEKQDERSDSSATLEHPSILPHPSPNATTIGQKPGGEKKNSTAGKDNGRRYQSEDVARLIDRDDNEYVISHPGKRSQMQFQEDLMLIRDIVVVMVASALGAIVFAFLGQPVILGYLAAGMFVGPGGLHLVHELVQVETLAQFGVIFLLFALGVEFSATKMQGVKAVALGGGCIQILTAMVLGALLSTTVPQGIFIGAFLSMSSTAVVVKCMMDANMAGTEHGQILLGTLIFQDCALGLLLAVMPALAAKGSSSWTILIALARECLLLSGFCAVAWIASKLVVSRLLSALSRLSKNSSELYQLGIVGLCLSISMLSQSLGLGLEVGAFVAGLMLSGGTYSEKTLHHVEPIRNIFASLFLASIGMVMHPVFLWQHKDILLGSLAVLFFGKTFLIAIVVCAFGYSTPISVSVGIALAQIGEFSFVLLSRAQGLGLVSRKLYLLLMGTSAFSLVLTPFAFKLVARLVPREKKSQ
ncbi:K(+) efflux antiporter 5 isoform X2 [Selaginella moellendorffii]|nr:K(+) efflux antiporter 5 isoform X2 [Selaginella moellendorffii]|eukprot:XP_024528725.1 K(+) efflux antiporter 5 isoform X2 [Selaginella moellendorffii]